MTPFKIIEQLDELRAKWHKSGEAGVEMDSYTDALFELYPELRKAVLAGSKLAEAVREWKEERGTDTKLLLALAAYHAEVNESNV